MSLLHQESPDQLDDAARGESFTRGTSPIVLASIVAVVVVSAVIAAYVLSGQKPPAVTGQVLEVWAHPMHTTSPSFDANGQPVPQESSDHVLVFTRVRLHNQGSIPLFLTHVMANATLADGVHSSYAASASDYGRIFQAYPELTPWQSSALDTEVELQPGQTLDGTFATSFTMTKADWEARKGLDFTLDFRYQPPLNLTPVGPVAEH